MDTVTHTVWKSPPVLYTAFAAVFITFRLILITVGTSASEYRLYYEYGDAVRKSSMSTLYHEQYVEYPQLAVLLGTTTCYVADVLPEESTRWLYARPNPTGPDDYARFESALAIVLLTFDLVCMTLVYLIGRRLYPEETHPRRVLRLVIYMVSTGALGFILYDRQDLVVAMFALLALWSLVCGWSGPGYLLLVIATAYKLVGALLLPVWILAAALLKMGAHASPREFLRVVLREVVIATTLFSLWPLLTYQFGGQDRAFSFLKYHSTRGLQIEAPLAWPTIIFDSAAEVTHGFGSFNFRSPFADQLAHTLKWVMLATALATILIAARMILCYVGKPNQPSAILIGPLVVSLSILIWLGFICTSKVGSPQYFLWIAPLIPLLPLKTSREWWWFGLIMLVMILTTAIYPCAYLYVKGTYRPDYPGTWTGPNVWTKALLTVRSLCLFAATGWFGIMIWRAGRRPMPSAISSSEWSPRHESVYSPRPVPISTP